MPTLQRTLSCLFLTFVMWGGMSASAQKSTLSVHLDGCAPQTRVVMSTVEQGRLQASETIGIDADGNFRVQIDESQPVFFVLQFERLSQNSEPVPIHVLMLPGEQVVMVLHADTVKSTLRVEQTTGSANMDEYRQFNNLLNDAIGDKTRQEQLAHRVEQLLVSGRNNLISAFLVTFFESEFNIYAQLYKYIADALSATYPNHEFVRYLRDKTSGMLLAGVEAPDIAMPDRNGQVRRLSDLRGRVVLLDFWASWCRPCRAENPNVVRLYKQYHTLGFEVFSVSLDKSRDQWLQAIEQDGLEWDNHVSDLRGWTSSGGKTYGISSIPATVLIGPDGKILARNLRGADLENALRQIFKQ